MPKLSTIALISVGISTVGVLRRRRPAAYFALRREKSIQRIGSLRQSKTLQRTRVHALAPPCAKDFSIRSQQQSRFPARIAEKDITVFLFHEQIAFESSQNQLVLD